MIHHGLSIPERELVFKASRSAGPGGQHVNKVNSRVTLRFDVRNSPSLTEFYKRRLVNYLGTRITRDGILQLHAQQCRSQSANREALRHRFVRLLRESLRSQPNRVPTKVPTAVKARRVQEKKNRGQVKKRRSSRIEPED